ncbi:FAD-dependent monooxygenase [Candidatus Palibaumannia cicadellinicola]|uniref:FAD-dependent monooxygenase n=1 Tax=Candidatus Palibaumannia cicadellinicola TaxID=186490 RepID=UPI0012E25582|nr:FAD-dependent monooxygenase [Candidatus Baumannia cicadellinicola]
MHKFDLVINGGGIVGLALACGAIKNNLRTLVIEQKEFFTSLHSSKIRVSAINTASSLLLKYLQVWNDLLSKGANPYHQIEVWDKDSFGKITFDCGNVGYQQLGYIIENNVIKQAMLDNISKMNHCKLLTSASLRDIVWGNKEVLMTLDNDQKITSKLVVAADGANSWLRNYADIPLTFWDQKHSALLATISTELPHEGIARQIFHGNGVLALLPLVDKHLNAIVWSMNSDLAQQLLVTSEVNFNAILAKSYDLALGLCTLKDERNIVPIRASYARNFVANRLVLIGDAAHTMHPLAGQGVNLGLMDTAELLSQINQLNKVGKDIGSYLSLRRYERNRKYKVAQMLTGIQVVRGLFDGNNPFKKLLRGIGLQLVDTSPSIKQLFINKAMGLNDMPSWLLFNDVS